MHCASFGGSRFYSRRRTAAWNVPNFAHYPALLLNYCAEFTTGSWKTETWTGSTSIQRDKDASCTSPKTKTLLRHFCRGGKINWRGVRRLAWMPDFIYQSMEFAARRGGNGHSLDNYGGDYALAVDVFLFKRSTNFVRLVICFSPGCCDKKFVVMEPYCFIFDLNNI